MSDFKYKILIVDDEEDLCEILQFNLEGNGYYTEVAYSAEEALKKDLKSFHLILLDVMMEKISGYKFAEIVRKELKNNVPIIFITAKTTENDLLTGFNIGADDFITKPYSIKEVIARIKALFNRIKTESISSDSDNITFENLTLIGSKKAVKLNNEEVKLTKKEYEILALLLQNQNKLLSRESILEKVWDDSIVVTERTVDVHIARLRKKIGIYGEHIKNRSGYGYSFEI